MVQYLPSPPQAVWHLGIFPIRAYALCIIAGALLAIWIAERRYQSRGGRKGVISDIAVWAIPFGIVGGRIYHVITDPELYFESGEHPINALKIWNGGLGIWGAVALGALGAWIGARRAGVRFAPVADVLAPALLVAQGVGRLGNWFNQELFGRPTTLPWGLKINLEHRPLGYEQYATFHPTFLYELIWDLAMAAVLLLLDRRYRFTHGRGFAVYVMLYTAGRFWIEQLRIDEANHIGPFRLNVWTAIIVFLGGLVYFVGARRIADRPDPLERS